MNKVERKKIRALQLLTDETYHASFSELNFFKKKRKTKESEKLFFLTPPFIKP